MKWVRFAVVTWAVIAFVGMSCSSNSLAGPSAPPPPPPPPKAAAVKPSPPPAPKPALPGKAGAVPTPGGVAGKPGNTRPPGVPRERVPAREARNRAVEREIHGRERVGDREIHGRERVGEREFHGHAEGHRRMAYARFGHYPHEWRGLHDGYYYYGGWRYRDNFIYDAFWIELAPEIIIVGTPVYWPGQNVYVIPMADGSYQYGPSADGPWVIREVIE